MSAMLTHETAIRTGGWAIPRREGDRRAKRPSDPRKFYFVFDPEGDRVGYISHSDDRPALEYGGPTYFLKRCPPRLTNQYQ